MTTTETILRDQLMKIAISHGKPMAASRAYHVLMNHPQYFGEHPSPSSVAAWLRRKGSTNYFKTLKGFKNIHNITARILCEWLSGEPDQNLAASSCEEGSVTRTVYDKLMVLFTCYGSDKLSLAQAASIAAVFTAKVISGCSRCTLNVQGSPLETMSEGDDDDY